MQQDEKDKLGYSSSDSEGSSDSESGVGFHAPEAKDEVRDFFNYLKFNTNLMDDNSFSKIWNSAPAIVKQESCRMIDEATGKNLLIFAAEKGNKRIINLLKYYSDIDLKDKDGNKYSYYLTTSRFAKSAIPPLSSKPSGLSVMIGIGKRIAFGDVTTGADVDTEYFSINNFNNSARAEAGAGSGGAGVGVVSGGEGIGDSDSRLPPPYTTAAEALAATFDDKRYVLKN